MLSDDSVASLGTAPTFISSLFGSLFKIATPQNQTRRREPQPQPSLQLPPPQDFYDDEPSQSTPNRYSKHESHIYIMTEPPSPQSVEAGSSAASPASKKEDEEEPCSAKVVMVTLAMPSQFRHTEPDFNENIDCTPRIFILKNGKSKLTDFFPPAGYFVAGGISGVVSRTVTAPLDRLKVYLIASTEARKPNLKGGPIQALKGSTGVLVDACRILWKTGGIRSLYAGKSHAHGRTHNRMNSS